MLDGITTVEAGTTRSAADFLDYLTREGHLDPAATARARAAMESSGATVDTVLTELGLLPEHALAAAQAGFLGLTLVDGHEFPVAPVAEDLVPEEFLSRAGLIPLSLDDRAITVAACRPLADDSIRALGFFLNRRVVVRVAGRTVFEREFDRLYRPVSPVAAAVALEAAAGEDDFDRLRDIASEAPVIRLVNRLVAEAAGMGASDIHIESLDDHLRVRFRVDGVLRTVERLDKSLHAGLVSRIKILARLNIAERRLPQDGRFRMAVRGSEVDFRVSTVPALHGESAVMRILDRRELMLEFPALGFDAQAAAEIERLIATPNGVVLVTGPTGSGKTTTLYAAMTRLNSAERKILTIEDPIEYHLPGINQTQVKPQIGLDFATALRAFLRQDPDIVMVGEIRDGETARTAIQAALTGHLVLSTLHTNSAAAALARLTDMGVETYLLVSALRGVIAQRLVRRLCPSCARRTEPNEGFLASLGLSESLQHRLRNDGIPEAVGCPACRGSGYRGRSAIHEILPLTPIVQEAVLKGASGLAIERVARQNGMRPLFLCGTEHVAAGETTFEEVLRATAALP